MGVGTWFYPADVSDIAQVRAMRSLLARHFGSIDILVNNAGISAFGDAGRTSLEDYHDIMAVNFFGALHCMRETLPFMLRRESGLIVNVATVAALHGVPYLAAYGASKAALVSLSESLRAELHGTGVGVMIVYPTPRRRSAARTDRRGATRRRGGSRKR
jgi:short-subunit dehydrogenase